MEPDCGSCSFIRRETDSRTGTCSLGEEIAAVNMLEQGACITRDHAIRHISLICLRGAQYRPFDVAHGSGDRLSDAPDLLPPSGRSSSLPLHVAAPYSAQT